jgi:hypothetical protein
MTCCFVGRWRISYGSILDDAPSGRAFGLHHSTSAGSIGGLYLIATRDNLPLRMITIFMMMVMPIMLLPMLTITPMLAPMLTPMPRIRMMMIIIMMRVMLMMTIVWSRG